MSEAKKYRKIVEWSAEDDCYIGTCPGIMFGGVHGASEIKVYRALCAVVREMTYAARRPRRTSSSRLVAGRYVSSTA